MKKKYLKVMFGNISGANGFEYKENEINIALNWNPKEKEPEKMGGFNFSVEDKILRYLVRGDTICDIELPRDAEVIDCPNKACPHGIFRANKIIVKNLRPMTDELAMHFYRKAKLPKKSFYKSLAGCAIRGYEKTAITILREKVNKKNINLVLNEVDDFLKPGTYWDKKGNEELIDKIYSYLKEIENKLFITIHIDRKPYIKTLSNDKIINLTGESDSGKSYFSNKYKNNDNYIVIDTDTIFSNLPTTDKYSLELRNLFKGLEKDYLITNFDEFYLKILDYFKDTNKTIVIDSAQYRNIKDYSILKGKIIVMRTSIDACYERCLKRYELKNPNASLDDKEKFANKKLGMYEWYKNLNKFLENVDKL